MPFAAPAHNLLVDDIDGDGRPDLALTSHHQNYTQVFYQRAPRQFLPGRQIDAVGFHPGELMRYPFTTDRRLYIMNAEGVNRLLVFEPDRNGDLHLIAELGAKAPRSGTFFNWPAWGKGIALTPFAESAIYLVKDFDPLSGHFGGSAELPFRPSGTYAHAVSAADIDHDGSDELFFSNTLSNVVSIIRQPPPGAEPVIEPLWSFNPGGRPEKVIPADIDQDGDIDLLIPDATDKRPLDRTDINVLLNDGQGRFALAPIQFPSRHRSAGGITGIQELDFAKDRDGYGYIAAAGYEAVVFMRIPAGWKGETPQSRSVPLQGIQAITRACLIDIDGDGWLDLAFSRTHDQISGVILWGPLWEHAKQLVDEGVKID
ncbi:VCBS repeat-containing protein [Caldichromatium japonicum]|uniref:VCBS repeat-containing protein n=1 Tax=Caldichromatium japonicum TaxID=2699430 RepID=A0A6G7VEY8_9GAMM|nr:VCBS repeat-containing protein [Caldichromatium japonicum]QIK38609.1 VCBS repeat-containing protein [Caldichromatium japonicum]